MPKVSQTDILTLILRDLDQIIETQKKAGIGSIPEATTKAAQAEASALGGTLSNLAVSLKMLSTISTKDVDHILYTLKTLHTAIKGFKLTKSDTEGFSHMISAITSLTSTFGNMSEGIWDMMKKYNPIRGRMLGKRIAKFYKGIIQGFEKEKLADYIKQVAALGGKNKEGSAANITAFSGLLTSLFSIDPKKVVQLSASLKLLRPKDGQRLADFISPIIEVIKNMPNSLKIKDGKKEGWKENPNITAFIGLLNALASITFASILRIWAMSKLLGPDNGKTLAGFFEELLKPFKSKSAIESAKNFKKVVNTFNTTIITLVACLAIITLLIVSKPKEFLIGLGVITALVAGVYIMIKFLSSKSIQESAKESLYTVTGILMLMGGLTLVLLLTMHIAKKYPLEDIGMGILILGGIVLFSLGIMRFLSKNQIQEQSKKALWGVAAIVLMFTGMALAMFITISIGKDADQILKGAGIVLLYTAVAAGIFILISKLLKPKTVLSGLMGVGAIVAMTVSLTLAMMLYTKFMKQTESITGKQVAKASGLMLGMVVGVSAVAMALGGIFAFPVTAALFLAGFAAVETISLMIASISGAMLTFTIFVEKMSKLKPEDFENAMSRINGNPGMISTLKQIVSALDEFSFGAMIKMGIIGMNLRPIFDSLNMFVDIIQKMAKMEILDHYDDKGKPVYRRMTNKEFVDAGKTVTDAFTYFLTELSTGLESIGNADYLRKVIDALFPPQQGGFFSLFKKTKKQGIGDIIPVISKFVDIIIKYASMTIPTEWNKDGVPIKYRRVENKEFIEAAKTVTQAFTAFLLELSNGLSQISDASYLSAIIGQLFPSPKKVRTGLFRSKMVEQPGIGSVIQAISDFSGIIIQMASSMIPDEWDKEGNPIHYRKLENKEFITAALVTTKCFVTFLSNLADGLINDVGPIGVFAIKAIADSGIDKIMESIGSLIMPLLNVAAGKVAIGDKVVDVTPEMMITASAKLVDILKEYAKVTDYFTSDSFLNRIFKGSNCDASIEIMTKMLEFITKLSSTIGTEEYAKSQVKMISNLSKLTEFLLADDFIKMTDATYQLQNALKYYEGSIKYLAKSKYLTPKSLAGTMKSLDVAKAITDFLNENKFSEENANAFNYTITKFAKGMDTLSKSLIKFLPVSKLIRRNVLLRVPKEVDKVTKSIRRLDATLIGNQKKRIEAIQTMSDKFAEVSKSIEDLNKSMAQSNRIIREFEGEKESRSFSIFGHLADRFNVVDKIKSNVEDTAIAAKAQADELSKRNQKAPEIDTAAIVAAITAGLNDWVESQKIVNITFGEDDAKRIVGIMGES